jgi:hypothetical protein
MTCLHSRRDVSISTSFSREDTSSSFSLARSMHLIAYSIEEEEDGAGDDDDDNDDDDDDDDRRRCLPDRTTENAPFPRFFLGKGGGDLME